MDNNTTDRFYDFMANLHLPANIRDDWKLGTVIQQSSYHLITEGILIMMNASYS